MSSVVLSVMAGRELTATILDLISAQNAGWKKRNSRSLMLSQRNKEELPQMVSADLCLDLRTLSSVPCSLLIESLTRGMGLHVDCQKLGWG